MNTRSHSIKLGSLPSPIHDQDSSSSSNPSRALRECVRKRAAQNPVSAECLPNHPPKPPPQRNSTSACKTTDLLRWARPRIYRTWPHARARMPRIRHPQSAHSRTHFRTPTPTPRRHRRKYVWKSATSKLYVVNVEPDAAARSQCRPAPPSVRRPDGSRRRASGRRR